ncbi:hypothetical protein LCGC14_1701140, partial [marine sediment metagenome]
EKKMYNGSLMIGNIGLGEGSVIVTEDVEKGNELIWMQFTGLKDKNGKEIFEGDVLQINPKGLKYFIVQSFILDTYTLWKMIAERLNNPMKKYTKIEVIGNIYENPELLEDKK